MTEPLFTEAEWDAAAPEQQKAAAMGLAKLADLLADALDQIEDITNRTVEQIEKITGTY